MGKTININVSDNELIKNIDKRLYKNNQTINVPFNYFGRAILVDGTLQKFKNEITITKDVKEVYFVANDTCKFEAKFGGTISNLSDDSQVCMLRGTITYKLSDFKLLLKKYSTSVTITEELLKSDIQNTTLSSINDFMSKLPIEDINPSNVSKLLNAALKEPLSNIGLELELVNIVDTKLNNK